MGKITNAFQVIDNGLYSIDQCDEISLGYSITKGVQKWK